MHFSDRYACHWTLAISLTMSSVQAFLPPLYTGGLSQASTPACIGRDISVVGGARSRPSSAGVLSLCASKSEAGLFSSRREACAAIAGLLIGSGAGPARAKAELDEEVLNAKIIAGYVTLEDLYNNWDKYAGVGESANGDNVRRQVGTVGNKSPLFGIRKVLLKRQLEIDMFEEIDRLLTQIDNDAYSAVFADSSTSPKRGYEYISDAKKSTKKALKVYKEILGFFGLEAK